MSKSQTMKSAVLVQPRYLVLQIAATKTKGAMGLQMNRLRSNISHTHTLFVLNEEKLSSEDQWHRKSQWDKAAWEKPLLVKKDRTAGHWKA